MPTSAQYRNGILNYYDRTSLETTLPVAPVSFYEEFLGKGLRTTDVWTAIDVSSAGDTAPLVAPDAANGVARLPLDVTSEAQESGLTWGDQRPFVLNQGLVFEAIVALQTLPTLLGIAVWGVAGDKNAVANTVAESAWFRAAASGAITVETDDTALEQTAVATGVTVVAGAFHTYRIDCTDTANVKFFIDGVQVAAATTFSMVTVPTLKLQPYFHIAKASGAGLGVLDVDAVRVWQRRS